MFLSTFVQNLVDAFSLAVQNLWAGVVNIVPELIVAVIFFAIGWILAELVMRLVESLFKSLKIDSLLKSAGFEDVVKRSGHNLNSGMFVGVIVKWFIILSFLIASFNALNLPEVSGFLSQVVTYIPQVIVAVIILMATVIVANLMQKVVVASSRASNITSAELLGSITKWAIWIFGLLTALFNLGIAPGLIQTVITAVFAAGAIAFGLAFGLGGKEAAQRIIDKTTHKLMN